MLTIGVGVRTWAAPLDNRNLPQADSGMPRRLDAERCTSSTRCPIPATFPSTPASTVATSTMQTKAEPIGPDTFFLATSPLRPIWRFRMYSLRYLPLAFVAALTSGALGSGPHGESLPDLLIGYTEHRTDLPGGRHTNVKTRRA